MEIIALLWLMNTASAQSTIPQPSGNPLLIVTARKIAGTKQTLDIELRSGDHIDVPAEDADDHATEIVRAALRSQSPTLNLTPPENVVVLDVAALTEADNHGRVTVTLLSGATIHCRVEDVRIDPQLVFLRTVLAQEISIPASTHLAPSPAPQTATAHSYGPSFQFDTKGVDFSSWLRGFRAQVYRNWLIPYAAMNLHGHTGLRFTIHKDGSITDLNVLQPSSVEAFTKGAFNAIHASNPTLPLPAEYPDERMMMTVVFYYNEAPPQLGGRPSPGHHATREGRPRTLVRPLQPRSRRDRSQQTVHASGLTPRLQDTKSHAGGRSRVPALAPQDRRARPKQQQRSRLRSR